MKKKTIDPDTLKAYHETWKQFPKLQTNLRPSNNPIDPTLSVEGTTPANQRTIFYLLSTLLLNYLPPNIRQLIEERDFLEIYDQIKPYLEKKYYITPYPLLPVHCSYNELLERYGENLYFIHIPSHDLLTVMGEHYLRPFNDLTIVEKGIKRGTPDAMAITNKITQLLREYGLIDGQGCTLSDLKTIRKLGPIHTPYLGRKPAVVKHGFAVCESKPKQPLTCWRNLLDRNNRGYAIYSGATGAYMFVECLENYFNHEWASPLYNAGYVSPHPQKGFDFKPAPQLEGKKENYDRTMKEINTHIIDALTPNFTLDEQIETLLQRPITNHQLQDSLRQLPIEVLLQRLVDLIQ
jgi:hypothetical protein